MVKKEFEKYDKFMFDVGYVSFFFVKLFKY